MLSPKSKKKMASVATRNEHNGDVVIEGRKKFSVCLEVAGTAPLIQHNFDEKTIWEMLRKHMGFSVERERKKPRELIERAKTKNTEGRICVPPQAFKAAMLTASMTIKSLKKTRLRTSIFVRGVSIPITFDREEARMDVVRTSGMNKQPDIRFRPEFHGWKARLLIQHADDISTETVIDLVNRAGSVGVGEWRPERNGSFGTFEVDRTINTQEEMKDVLKECSVPLISPRIPDWALDQVFDPDVLKDVMETQGEREDDEEGDQEEVAG